MCNKSRSDAGLGEDEADWLSTMFQSLCQERIDKLTGYLFVVISLNLFCFGLL